MVEVGGAEPPTVWGIVRGNSLEPLGEADAEGLSVDARLSAMSAAPLSERIPVLAIGSNACLAQMAHKYIRSDERLVYVQIPVAVSGLDVGYASIVAGYGAVPATAVPSAPAPAMSPDLTIALQYLDADFVKQLDQTEIGYQRISVGAVHGVSVRTRDGERLEWVDVYVATGGVLGDDAGIWLLGDGVGRLDQAEVMGRLLGISRAEVAPMVANSVTVPDDPAAIADGGELTRLLRKAIAASDKVKNNGFVG